GSDSYYQSFEINEGKQVNDGTSFIINGEALKQGKDFFPFVYSPNISLEAIPAISVQESDMPWFIDLKEVAEENANNARFDLKEYIHSQAVELKKRGATALIFYNSLKDEELKFDGKDKSEATKI